MSILIGDDMNQYKICYTATWPDGKLLDPKKPCMNAYIEADSEVEAAAKLMNELQGLKVKVLEKPQIVESKDGL